MFADDLEKAWAKFAYEANRFANRAQALSPASLDFEQRLKEQWEKRKISERFRELERVMDAD